MVNCSLETELQSVMKGVDGSNSKVSRSNSHGQRPSHRTSAFTQVHC